MMIMMKFLSIIILSSILLQTKCLFTFFQPILQNTSYYKCIKPTTNGRIILYFQYHQDKFDQNHFQNLQNALEAGLNVEIIMETTRCRPVDEELKFLSKTLEGKSIDRFWIILEDTDPGCSWQNYSAEQNCQYLLEYIFKGGQLGMKINIATLADTWILNFKDQTACPEASTSLLWWFPSDEKEYQQFGGICNKQV